MEVANLRIVVTLEIRTRISGGFLCPNYLKKIKSIILDPIYFSSLLIS